MPLGRDGHLRDGHAAIGDCAQRAAVPQRPDYVVLLPVAPWRDGVRQFCVTPLPARDQVLGSGIRRLLILKRQRTCRTRNSYQLFIWTSSRTCCALTDDRPPVAAPTLLGK